MLRDDTLDPRRSEPSRALQQRLVRTRVALAVRAVALRCRAYFRDNDPTFAAAFTPALIVCALVFVRSPTSNYIFDEQEALLANPYVNGRGLAYWEALKVDFWGLPPDRSIGSYRPIPNLVWRALWQLSEAPWLHHWVNVIVHSANAAVLASFSLRLSGQRAFGWLSGACFLLSAVLTEAITGVVGIADVCGGLGVLLALSALRLSLAGMPAAVFAAISFGLFSKESAIVALPLVAWAALVTAPVLHVRPRRVLRAALALAAAAAALVVYTYVRRHFFPVSLPEELQAPVPTGEPLAKRLLFDFLRWFQQPRLPNDPINNPLAEASFPERVAGGLRVYLRGLGQVLFPWRLSGDYSYAQEPIPRQLISAASVAGAALLVLPPLVAFGAWLVGLYQEAKQRYAPLRRTLLLALALFWIPVAYFPHSNIPVVLPTVRAERFWYLPVIGCALLLALLFVSLRERGGARARRAAGLLIALFLVFQAVRARQHASDYTSDLHFWRATRESAPNSAKAHLNYSVMLGARGELERRLEVNARALEIAPRWPMAHVYYADTLCRLKRADAAWPHYVRGFELAPNDPNLIALGLQCLWDAQAIQKHHAELRALAERHKGTWLGYLASDIVYNGEKHGGVDRKYRPRGYDEGPKND